MMRFVRNTYTRAAGLVIVLALILAGAAWFRIPASIPPYPELPKSGAVQNTHDRIGPIRPQRALPAMSVVLEDGKSKDLNSVLADHWTLAQFMFTGCSTTCPIQGAIFARTQAELKSAGIEAQLLSISIDPLGDSPAALTTWLNDFGSGAGWHAAIPPLASLGPLLDVMGGRGEGVDIHTASVYLIGPDAKLYYITEDMPNPAFLVKLVTENQARS
jgi:protein SCO1